MLKMKTNLWAAKLSSMKLCAMIADYASMHAAGRQLRWCKFFVSKRGTNMPEFLETVVDKFTFKVAVDRSYNSEGVWALAVGSVVRVGLSDFLQQRSGDIAFAEILPVGKLLAVKDEIAAIETIKVNIALSSPVAGKVIRTNPLMESAPETINQDPYGEGWLCEIEAADWESDRKNLLDAAAYFAQMKREAENEVKKNG
jgi:glycine cleavage system H protein